MNKNAELWIKALRSGHYSQTTGSLSKNEKDESNNWEVGYCCLGVACDLYSKFRMSEGEGDRWVEEVVSYKESGVSVHVRRFQSEEDGVIEEQESQLPFEVRSWLGLNSEAGYYESDEDGPIEGLYSLADVNDAGIGFEEIADLIEKEPNGLFIVAKERAEVV